MSQLSRRTFVTYGLFGSQGLLAACGGGDATADDTADDTAQILANPPRLPLPIPPPSPPPVGTMIAMLVVKAGASAGTLPYSATVLPLRGHVPAGTALESPDDSRLRGSVLSAHDDGSAAVVVVSGMVTVAASGHAAVRLQAGFPVAGSAMTAASIASLVSSVSVAFGAPYGTAMLTSLSNPERIWWANAQTICARYRVAAPTPGTTQLEAVIDIQAWAGRARVEVVIENSKMVTATPTKPTAANYTGATVSINGGLAIATVNSSGMPIEGVHSAFRAWYASGWVGGDPGLRVTQRHTELQQHPLLFKCDQVSNFAMSGYASDAYSPWSTGRQRATGMGGTGDHDSIGPLPKWEARALQSGDHRAWQATEVSALAVLGYNVNYRDRATGLVPTITELAGKSQQSNWPSQSNGSDAMQWKTSHHPAAGLMAFIGRPSPVFIEIAQKVAAWNGTWSTYDGSPSGATTGVFVRAYEWRGRAWGLRSLAHATFLTPETHAWKAAGKSSIAANVSHFTGWAVDSKARLNMLWDSAPNSVLDHDGSAAGFQFASWYQHYLITEVHKVATTRLLTGADQTAIHTLADWVALQPVRWVNEQASTGAHRYITYKYTMGRNASTIDSLPNYAQQSAWAHGGLPPAVSGPWMSTASNTYAGATADALAGAYYPSYFWSALVAACERGLPGAEAAMITIEQTVTNLSTWRLGFATDPRWGSVPKNSTALPAWVPAPGNIANIGSSTVFSVRPPGWPGNESLGPIALWSGAVWAPEYGTGGGYILHGSGHQAPGTPLWAGVWVFDVASQTWVGCNVPSQPLLERSAPLTIYNEFGESTVAGTIGHTYPPHTYSGLIYQSPANGGGANGSLIRNFFAGGYGAVGAGTQSVHRFDLSSATAPPTRVHDGITMGGSGNYPMAALDRARGGYWLLSYTGLGPLRFVSFADWSATPVPGVGYNEYGDQFLIHIPAPYDVILGFGRTEGTATAWTYRASVITAGVPGPFNVITINGTAPSNSRSGGCWSTLLNQVVSYNGFGSTAVHKLTPPSVANARAGTGTWAWSTETLGGVAPAFYSPENAGMYSRLQEAPQYRCFLLANSIHSPLQAFRLAGM